MPGTRHMVVEQIVAKPREIEDLQGQLATPRWDDAKRRMLNCSPAGRGALVIVDALRREPFPGDWRPRPVSQNGPVGQYCLTRAVHKKGEPGDRPLHICPSWPACASRWPCSLTG